MHILSRPGIILLAICFAMTGLLGADEHASSQIDLREVDLNGGEIAYLTGPWYFHWGVHVDSANSSHLAPAVPIEGQYWNEVEIFGETVPPRGYATYVSRIILDSAHVYAHLAFLVRENNLASRYFVNGREIGSVGNPSIDPALEIGTWEPQVLGFREHSDTLDITVHVSNHQFRNGGLGRTVAFGTATAVIKLLDNLRYRDLFFIGIYLILAVYHLGIFILRPRDIYSRWLIAIYLLLVARLLFSGNFTIFMFVEHIPWSGQIRLEYLSLYLSVPITALYFSDAFKSKLIPFTRRIILVIMFVFLSTLIIPNTYAISQIARIFLFLIIPICVLPFIAVYRSAWHGDRNARIIVGGAAILGLAAINDSLYTLDYINTGFIVPYAFLLFIVSQAFLVARNYALAYESMELNKQQLEQEVDRRLEAESLLKNNQLQLQKLVEQRTAELARMNVELKNEIQHRTRHEADLEDSNTTKDKFFSIIAHDLRGPVSSLAQLMEHVGNEFKTFERDELEEMFTEMSRTAGSVHKLVENLLAWSRLQLGKISFEPGACFARKLVDEAVEIIRGQARAKDISITSDVPRKLKVMADPRMVDTVLRNLLTNAIKFSHRGGKIQVNAISTATSRVLFQVVDEGIGMTQKQVDQLFDVGMNFKSFGTEDEVGTGLGLLLCKELLEKHGGKIHVTSSQQMGSTFAFTLPIP